MCEIRSSDNRMVPRAVLTALFSAVLAGCAVGPERPDAVYETPADRPDQTPAAVEPEASEDGVRQASNSLLLEARSARAQGALDRAEALLQRAQRIDPGNATVYLELAGLYSQRGQDRASRAVAERGLLYCRGSGCDDLRDLAAH